MQKKVYKVEYNGRVLELGYKHVVEAEQTHQELLDIAKRLGW